MPSTSVATVTQVTGLTGSGQGADLPGPVHDPESMTGTFQNIHVTPPVECDCPGIDQRCFSGFSSIRGHALPAVSGY